MWTLDTFKKPYHDKPIAQKFGYPSLAVLGCRKMLFGLTFDIECEIQMGFG